MHDPITVPGGAVMPGSEHDPIREALDDAGAIEAAEEYATLLAAHAMRGAKIERLREENVALRAANHEAHALIETAERDGHVSPGWREDARTWQGCWRDA